jgi:hypothetical protein
MRSKNGLIFGVINIIGNFATVFQDQAYWYNIYPLPLLHFVNGLRSGNVLSPVDLAPLSKLICLADLHGIIVFPLIPAPLTDMFTGSPYPLLLPRLLVYLPSLSVAHPT